MEILLNLAWAALAVTIVCLWFRFGDRTGIDRRRQIVALMVLIAILFPVISVSDDLMAVQNATEQDQRRDSLLSDHAHPIVPLSAILPVFNLDASPSSALFVSTRRLTLPAIEHPELSSVENRPPPAI